MGRAVCFMRCTHRTLISPRDTPDAPRAAFDRVSVPRGCVESTRETSRRACLCLRPPRPRACFSPDCTRRDAACPSALRRTGPRVGGPWRPPTRRARFSPCSSSAPSPSLVAGPFGTRAAPPGPPAPQPRRLHDSEALSRGTAAPARSDTEPRPPARARAARQDEAAPAPGGECGGAPADPAGRDRPPAAGPHISWASPVDVSLVGLSHQLPSPPPALRKTPRFIS